MKWRHIIAVCLAALTTGTASAHRIDEYLQATLLTVEPHQVRASMRLIPGVMVGSTVIDLIDTDHDGLFSDAEELHYAQRVLGELTISVNGAVVHPALGSYSFPRSYQLRDGLGEIHIEYSVDLPPGNQSRSFILTNQHLRQGSVYLVNVLAPQDGTTRVLAQKRNQQQSEYEVDFEQTVSAPQTPWLSLRMWAAGLQLSALFHLGMRHIAEGADHLLFLLALLLPAPLCAVGGRWAGPVGVRRSLLHILSIVSAFTLGHSLTLALAAMNVVRVGQAQVELLIALSILISAVHALRPIFPGKEAWIAMFFGLIHGLAFASTLSQVGLTRWSRVAGIFAFSVGIETMQLLVVVLILPSLLLLSRVSAYQLVRVAGGVVAGAAAIGWVVERSINVRTPVDAIANGIARHEISAALMLLAFSVGYRYLQGKTQRPGLRLGNAP